MLYIHFQPTDMIDKTSTHLRAAATHLLIQGKFVHARAKAAIYVTSKRNSESMQHISDVTNRLFHPQLQKKKNAAHKPLMETTRHIF